MLIVQLGWSKEDTREGEVNGLSDQPPHSPKRNPE